jgi:hypothetical protein
MLDYLSDFFKGNRQIKENDKIGRGDDNWERDVFSLLSKIIIFTIKNDYFTI